MRLKILLEDDKYVKELVLNEYERTALEDALAYLMRDKTYEINNDPDHEDPRNKNINRTKREFAKELYLEILASKSGKLSKEEMDIVYGKR